MDLLVVTPTLGYSPFLEAAAESVRAAAPSVRLVMVAPRERHQAVRAVAGAAAIVPDEESGMYGAINAGIAAARDASWDWFSYLNDDDIWEPAGMQVLLQRARNGDADIYYGRVRLIREDGCPAGFLPVARHPRDLLPLLSRGIVPFAQPGMLIRRSFVERLGGFDSAFRAAGDLDFFVRALKAGARFAFIPAIVAAFRLQPGQLSRQEELVRAEKARALASIRDAGALKAGFALLRFRMQNIGTYVDRLRRYGPMRMSEVYRNS